jgi:hypothetical protein
MIEFRQRQRRTQLERTRALFVGDGDGRPERDAPTSACRMAREASTSMIIPNFTSMR